MANTKVTGDLIASGTITADNLVSGTLDTLLNDYLTNNTYATQGYVTTAVNNLIAAAPASLDTLNELAAALNDDANFATTVTDALAGKLNLTGGTLTGGLNIEKTTLADAIVGFQNYTDVNPNYGSIGINTSGYLQIHSSNGIMFRGGLYYFEHMRLDSSGNLGIGTTSPIDKLHVSGGVTSTNISAPSNTSVGSLQIGYDGTNGIIRTWNSSPMLFQAYNLFRFDVSGSSAMTIDTNRNVGIGTTSPSEKLHIVQNTSDHLTFKLEQDNASYECWFEANSQDGGYFRSGISTDANNFAFFNTDQAAYRWYGAGGGSPSMTLTNGSLGIGTTSPSAKLHVDTNANNDGITLRGTSDNLRFNIKNDQVTSGQRAFSMMMSGSYPALIFQALDDNYGFVRNIMAIEHTGEVGIGTITPGAMLHVNGYTAIGSYAAPHYSQSGMAYQVIKAPSGSDSQRAMLEVHSGGGGTKGILQAVGGNNTVYVGTLTNSGLIIGNDVVSMAFNTAGNIGIGTTSPEDKLHVANGGLRVSTTANSNHLSIKNIQTSTASTAYEKKIRFLGYNNVEEASIVGLGNQYWGSAYNGIGFNVGTTRRMTINNSGDVNIGNGSSSGSLYFENDVKTRKIVLYSGAGNDNEFYGFGIESNTLVYSTYTANDDHVFFSGYSGGRNELMRVKGSGKIGIGTSSPHSKLHVEGDISQTSNSKTIVFSKTLSDNVGTDIAGFTGFTGDPSAATILVTVVVNASSGYAVETHRYLWNLRKATAGRSRSVTTLTGADQGSVNSGVVSIVSVTPVALYNSYERFRLSVNLSGISTCVVYVKMEALGENIRGLNPM